MFGHLKRGLQKVQKLTSALEKAEKENKTWKANQLKSKLYKANIKYFPNVIWDSNSKGTYIKPKEEK